MRSKVGGRDSLSMWSLCENDSSIRLWRILYFRAYLRQAIGDLFHGKPKTM